MSQVTLNNFFNKLICAIKGQTLMFTSAVETPFTIESGVNGSTPSGVKSFSIRFEGSNGILGNAVMNSGDVISKSATLANSLSSENYVVPDTLDTDFPFSPRVVISYVI